MKKQSYSNHRRYIPLYHYILLTLIVSLLIASVVNIMNLLEADVIEKDNLFISVLFALVSLIFGIIYYYMRAFALRVQDRAIRSEENFRHFCRPESRWIVD